MIKSIKKFLFSPKPELHMCPHCGSSIQRLYILSGGILHNRRVKMIIGCRDCHRSHTYSGKNVEAHWLALQLSKHPVREYTRNPYNAYA